MKRDAKFIEEAKRHDWYWYNYNVPAIEEFFQKIKDALYAEAIAFLPKIYEASKHLDYNNYHPEDLEHDQYVYEHARDALDSKIRDEQWDALKAIRAPMDEACQYIRKELDWYGVMDKKVLDAISKDMDYSEEVRKQAGIAADVLKRSDKLDKEVRNAHKQELDELKRIRENIKARKSGASAQKKALQALAKQYGNEVEKYDLQYLSENGIEAEAKRYSEFETIWHKRNLYQRVEEYVGKVVDMQAIYLGDKGVLNGIVKGESGRRAKVETALAGGYNIQCLHYRVLVNPL